jgi:[3-methyl-2-oxobutanoate dehydrogenase (acetyl-transferring)] kinase
VCAEVYGLSPEVVVTGDRHVRLPYIPGHLDYMLYELLKNAARAVVERHRGATYATRRGTLTPITVSERCVGNKACSAVSRHMHALTPGCGCLPCVCLGVRGVRQARICSGGSHLTIRISDQGGGIPPEHLTQV